MHIYFLQHTPSLDAARLEDWLESMGHSHNRCLLYANESPPRLEDCDGLVLLDGSMDLDTEDAPDWLRREKKLLNRALKSGKPVLGLGFGARLIAEALGAIVSRGTHAEIGWQTVQLAEDSPFDLPECFEALLWHRDIFGLPEDASPLGGSDASPLLGFSWDTGRVIALQCHLEATAQSAGAMLALTSSEKAASPHVQSDAIILEDPKRFDRQAPLLDRLLMQWLASVTT
ncbi:type 1 glutamine amidotransferase [Pistricoccus aurantiacus]|uniref:Type 1 glutamine amidotransferase n=1 Tax=Pistricoccus aurantiacus TaxID=1883414 RepID=A0A5B8SUG7_9GAMM|nr:type 1 glutamine amidotransferase [Pistricoccus aurantiacus]QEA38593.1 type 1 glutamine amidotransferase [Pistricoccus aurantiacus]